MATLLTHRPTLEPHLYYDADDDGSEAEMIMLLTTPECVFAALPMPIKAKHE